MTKERFDVQRPLHNGAPTSKAAAESLSDEALGRLRFDILKVIRRSCAHGRTCDEIEALLDLRHQTASARIHELLYRYHRIVDSGTRRKTRSGRTATVYVAKIYAKKGE